VARLRVLWVAMAAVLAMLALSATASAAPEWGACVKAAPKNTGSYADKLCSVASEPGAGKYELAAGSVGKGKRSKLKGLGSQVLHIVTGSGDVPITCEKLKGTGVPVAPDGVRDVVLEFKKCTTESGLVPCENVARETITTNPLAGTLAEVEGKVGEILEAESGSQLASEVVCLSVWVPSFPIVGRVFGEYTGNTNVISKTSTGHYTVGHYLGEVECEPFSSCEPLTNQPTEGPPSYGVLYAEMKQRPSECDEAPELCKTYLRPIGLEGTVEVKGEALMAKT
jgi:hypothetical protein